MYRERLEEIINELDSIVYAIRSGNQDPSNLQGTNLTPLDCELASEQLTVAFSVVEKFIDDHMTE